MHGNVLCCLCVFVMRTERIFAFAILCALYANVVLVKTLFSQTIISKSRGHDELKLQCIELREVRHTVSKCLHLCMRGFFYLPGIALTPRDAPQCASAPV